MPGGRPKGSVNRKRQEDSNSQRKLTSNLIGLSTSRSNRTRDDSESDTEQDRTLLREINTLQDNCNKAILDLRHTIDELTTENATLKQKCTVLDQKVVKLEEASKLHDQQINKQERFSRRNNVRIVGVDSSEGENCLQIAAQIFEEAGVSQYKIERAHRDGKFVEGRNRHILVKCSFFQDKILILRNARNALQSKPYFIIDDLTQVDLREKRKWSNKVQDLFRNGTRLHFSGGSWRDTSGRPFKFE
ncbi:LINE-1 retrotransposable element ORF1 protein [Holothuria leucospilota]|uniref:LINE-1 retrotransposable element ORF1 protein n=1 Tax=Holothuria leucospilota TaxID=206669 RepID=A0A9Q1BD40_HOLLE|nr:LINE-1 retrotransposable element ORF1 protein [Holothuria leucospilota]